MKGYCDNAGSPGKIFPCIGKRNPNGFQLIIDNNTQCLKNTRCRMNISHMETPGNGSQNKIGEFFCRGNRLFFTVFNDILRDTL